MTPSLPRIGTAGWSVPTQYADLVPAGGSHLERYARRLNAAEINSSFHSAHQRKTYQRWADSTPADFRFSVKVPKAMTHERGLADCGDLLDGFAEEVTGLGAKLSLLLVQLPPKLVLEKRMAGRFFRALHKRIDVPVVCEPRHASWFTPAANDWLAKIEIARVAADPARLPGGGEPGGWSRLAYYRWHGAPRVYYSEYEAAALSALSQRLGAHLKGGVPAWCIFDNTASSAALGNALDLAARQTQPSSVSAGAVR